jgi:universal stress protein A
LFPPTSFTRILVPSDFSAASDAALEYARIVAAKFGATVYLLHVIEAPFVTGPLGTEAYITDVPAVQQELFDDAKARLAHRVTADDRTRFNVVTDTYGGTSARTIVDYANEHGIELIVMGTHGRSGMAHLLMGSVAERVIRTAPCPVLTVRQAPVPFAVARSAAAIAVPA